jgi:hypothetical protein
VIFAEDAEKIFGKRIWASRSEEILEPIEESIAPAKTVEVIDTPEHIETPENSGKAKNPQVAETLEQPTMTEAPEYSNPTKPKSERPRKRKEEGLFGGFDFEQNDTTEEK